MVEDTAASYPVSVEAELDPNLSRWLWLVKWLLAIPHFVVLLLLWIAFIVTSVMVFSPFYLPAGTPGGY